MSMRVIAMSVVLSFSMLGEAQAARSLFDAMGGEAVLHDAVNHFGDIVEADSRINFTFADTNIVKFKQLLYDQLCDLSGGPCHYGGRNMHEAHAKLNITNAQFNALAEDLYLALGKAGVTYRQQNKLMALLAPMQHQIVKPGRVAPAFPTTQGSTPPAAPTASGVNPKP